MSGLNNELQIIIPDLAVYVDTIPRIYFQLSLTEVKKHGDYSNGTSERDKIKLGREMQMALNKLVEYNVKLPVVTGLLAEGLQVTTYKMDLVFNGQYRMIKISEFSLIRDQINDIMLVPTIMQSILQIKNLIEEAKESLFKAIRSKNRYNSRKEYIRKGCDNPLVVKSDNKGTEKKSTSSR